MSDKDINSMSFKQLRNEVQSLRDELAKMKRLYEDMFYNLDTDNFSSTFLKEQDNMKTQIKITADGIKTKVSKEDLNNSLSEYSTKTQTEEQISAAVVSVNTSVEEKLKNFSTVDMTAEQITAKVTKEYVTDLIDDEYATKSLLYSEIKLSADEINATVSDNYNNLDGKISNVSQTADSISSKVGVLENGKFGDYTLFTQLNNKFIFDGEYIHFTGAVIITDNEDNEAFSIFHNQPDGVVYMWGHGDYTYTPVVIGNKAADGATQGIYLYGVSDDNHIATRGWVRENASIDSTATAVFG